MAYDSVIDSGIFTWNLPRNGVKTENPQDLEKTLSNVVEIAIPESISIFNVDSRHLE